MTMSTETARQPAALSPEQTKTPTPAPYAAEWRTASIWLVLAIGGLTLLYWPTIQFMERLWSFNRSYTHCFFVLPIVGYMVWMNRRRLASIRPRPSAWGLAATLVMGVGWYVAHVGAILIGEHLSLVALFIALVWAILGGTVVRALAFPLSLLFLAVPFGEGLFPVLIAIASKLALAVLHVQGVPVGFDGTYIRLVNGEWRITEACSGLRFILSIVTVGAMFAYTTYSRTWKRIVFIASSVAAAILMNGARVWILVMVGLYTNMKSPMVKSHIWLGWVLFAIMVLTLFQLGRLWQDPEDVEDRPVPKERKPVPPRTANAALMGVLAIVFMGAWPLLGWAADHWSADDSPVVLNAPRDAGTWVSIESMPWEWGPHYEGAKALLHHAYQGPTRPVGMYAALFRNQRQGEELVRTQNGFQTPFAVAWRYTPVVQRKVQGLPFTVEQIEGRTRGARFRAWRWYWIGGEFTSDPTLVKLLGLRAKLLGQPDDAIVFVIHTPFELQPNEADGSLTAFMQEMKPSIDQMIATATGR